MKKNVMTPLVRVLLAGDNQSELEEGMIMRRKLVNGLLGGMLLHSIAPLDALAAGDSGPAITEAMILDFLRRLLQVARHDDLTDRAFVEKTLGVEFTLTSEGVPTSERDKKEMTHWQQFRLTSLGDPILQKQGSIREHHSMHKTPVPGIRAEASIALVFSPELFGTRGITREHMTEVFGKPRFTREIEAHVSSAPRRGYIHTSYAYRWEGRNSTVARSLFDGQTGFLMNVEVFQNTAALKHYPL